MNDTIAAIATTTGIGAISIIRVSGDETFKIVNKIFNKNLNSVKSHTINYGYIEKNGEIIDEVLITVMRAPKTYTREDIIEINCHGGIATTNKVLELVLESGARLAEPGEFTKRAFLNGRIDLTQADGIMDLISSKTDIERKIAIKQLDGRISQEIKLIRDDLIQIISNIEVNIDYPEYDDIEVVTNKDILPKLNDIKVKLGDFIRKSQNELLLKKGIKVGIIGRPNVGKSSLLNFLLGENKAIVTDIEGTTRDVIEGQITINGIIFNIIDTAGIRETDNLVEKIGVEKSMEIAKEADLIIFMLNNNEKITQEEIELIKKLNNNNKKCIYVVNKKDLETKIDIEKISSEYIKISANSGTNVNLIIDKIIDLYNLGDIEMLDFNYLSNARSINLLKQSLAKVDSAIEEIKNNNPIDIVELEIKNAWNFLGEITGEVYSEELLDEMFSRFCLGK